MKEDALVDVPEVAHFICMLDVVIDFDTNGLLLRYLLYHLQHVFHDVLGAFVNTSHFISQGLIYDFFAQV